MLLLFLGWSCPRALVVTETAVAVAAVVVVVFVAVVVVVAVAVFSTRSGYHRSCSCGSCSYRMLETL